MEHILQFVGVSSGFQIGIGMVIIVNVLHYKFGFFHPDSISSNDDHNVFYGEYLYVKIISFLTIGPSLYAGRARDAHLDNGA